MKIPRKNFIADRRARGVKLTQEELAILTGYDVTTVCKHEKGRGLTAEAIARYAKVLKCQTHELFFILD